MSEQRPSLDRHAYYKVLGDSQRSCHGGSGKWVKGRARSVKGDLVACKNGIHFCRRDQLVRWLGPSIWLFEDLSPDETVDAGDKMVTRRGRVVERVEAWNEATARLFVADCAEAVVHLIPESRRGPFVAAITAARGFARGEIGDKEMAAAGAAARAATGDAAGAAAGAAARDAARAAARDATGDAARAAARAATGDAARAAAGAAARDAARAATWAAAWAAARAATGDAAGAAAGAAARDAARAAARDATVAAAKAAAGAAARAAARAATWAAAWAAARDAQTEILFDYLEGRRS